MHDATRQDQPDVLTALSCPISWRRKLPLRMSVRALMLVVLIVAGLLGWVVHLAHVQRMPSPQ